jgi:hypothetical protein
MLVAMARSGKPRCKWRGSLRFARRIVRSAFIPVMLVVRMGMLVGDLLVLVPVATAFRHMQPDAQEH